MPAVSRSQRRTAAVAKRVKMGKMKLADVHPMDFRAAVKSMLSMSEDELDKMASTEEKGLPKHRKAKMR